MKEASDLQRLIENNWTSILMAHFPQRESKLKKYLSMGVAQKLFAGEEVRRNCETDRDFLVYYVLSGKCKVSFERADGSFLTLDTRGPNCLIQSEYHSGASISRDQLHIAAVENTVLIAFTKDQCYELICRDRDVFEDFLYLTNAFYAELTHRLLNTAYLSADQKLLIWLDKLCRSEQPKADGSYEIPCLLTQSEIAELLLIHLTTCNKLLSQLTREKILRKTKDILYIYRPDALLAYLDSGNKIVTEPF